VLVARATNDNCADTRVVAHPFDLFLERLHEVVAPTCVIVGSADVDLVLAGCRAAADGIRGADLVELAGTAHLPNLEVPNGFNTTVAAFLD
jgi:pimeloyl-ACP methyl ester carboxylesterase